MGEEPRGVGRSHILASELYYECDWKDVHVYPSDQSLAPVIIIELILV